MRSKGSESVFGRLRVIPLPFLGGGARGGGDPRYVVQPPPLTPPPKVGEGGLYASGYLFPFVSIAFFVVFILS